MQKKTNKVKKIVISLILISIMFTAIVELPTIADWGDYETYDSSSSYDSWDSGSSWSSSSSSWDSDSSWDWGSSSDSSWRSSSRSSSGGSFLEDLILLRLLFGTPIGWIVFFIIIIAITKGSRNSRNSYGNNSPRPTYPNNTVMKTQPNYEAIRQKVFNFNDTVIEDKIQADDPYFNKAEFLSWASDMYVKLQYAWSDRNLEDIRYFVTPELYEKTNNQVQRYITNKQINKLERVSVNVAKLHSFEQQGDRDVLKVILDSKMVDYIVDETTGKILRGDQLTNIMNPYILTFTRKTGIKTPEGGVKAVTMNCPNCGGATTILSSGKCPYCGSIITTRDNNWTLSEMTRYTPNS